MDIGSKNNFYRSILIYRLLCNKHFAKFCQIWHSGYIASLHINIILLKASCSLAHGRFFTKGHNLNNPCISPLGNATRKYLRFRSYVFSDFFSNFLLLQHVLVFNCVSSSFGGQLVRTADAFQ